MKVTQIRVDQLTLEGSNVRNGYTEQGLKDLQASILQHGVCVPLLVRSQGDRYEVLDGGRRLAAALKCGLERLPCVVVDGGDGAEAALAWVANFEREAVPFWEESGFFGRMVLGGAFSVERFAVAVGRSVGYVRSRLAVLEWPPALFAYCRAAGVSYSVAREYARLGDSVELERALDWDRVNQPSYRQAVAYVDEILRAREIVVRPEVVAAAVAPLVCVCDVCGGERDPRTSRMLLACASCVAALVEAHQGENPYGEKPKADGRPRRGRGGRQGTMEGKAAEDMDEAAAEADKPRLTP